MDFTHAALKDYSVTIRARVGCSFSNVEQLNGMHSSYLHAVYI